MSQTTRSRTAAPYARLHASSLERSLTRAAPRGLTAQLRWARWAYRQEPPIRLHVAAIGADGAPRLSGDFAAWINGLDGACGQDEEGYLRTPFRCAIYAMHGRRDGTDEAMLADFVLALAGSDTPWDEIARRFGIGPDWVQPIIAREALRRLWERYAPAR